MLKKFMIVVAALTCVGLSAGQIETKLQYLAWKPFGASIVWAEIQTPPSGLLGQVIQSKILQINPGFRSGVQAEISYSFCDFPCRAIGRYSWVEYSTKVRVVNPPNSALIVAPSGFSSTPGSVGLGRLKQPFHAADLYIGYDLCQRDHLHFSLLGGGTFLYVDRSYQAFLIAPAPGASPYSSRTRFVGGGPMLGIQATLPLGCFSAYGEVSVASLIGRRLNRNHNSFTRVVNPTLTGLSTGLLADIGLAYSRDFCDRTVGVELGWEQRAYHNVTALRRPAGLTFGNSASDQDFLFISVGGPHVGASVQF